MIHHERFPFIACTSALRHLELASGKLERQTDTRLRNSVSVITTMLKMFQKCYLRWKFCSDTPPTLIAMLKRTFKCRKHPNRCGTEATHRHFTPLFKRTSLLISFINVDIDCVDSCPELSVLQMGTSFGRSSRQQPR